MHELSIALDILDIVKRVTPGFAARFACECPRW